MNTPADNIPSVPRARLCQLAEVDRGKHGRWQARGLLAKRSSGYGLLDALQAAQLDELSSRLGPKAATIVWRRIREQLGIPGRRLEVVVELATFAATLVRSDAQLASALPRGQELIVIEFTSRSARARERFQQFVSGGEVTDTPEHGSAKADSEGAG
jgi:hypothetical protein